MANKSIYDAFSRLWQHTKTHVNDSVSSARIYTDDQITNVRNELNTLALGAEEAFASMDNNILSLSPGAITWNRDTEGRMSFQAGASEGMSYGYVQVSNIVLDRNLISLFMQTGAAPILGYWTIEDGYISMPGQITWIDENQSGIIIYPEDDGADMGAIILLETYDGLPAGVYFSAVEDSDLAVVVGAVVSLFIPGYGHVESNGHYVNETTLSSSNTFSIPYTSASGTEMEVNFQYLGECDLSYEDLIDTDMFIIDNGVVHRNVKLQKTTSLDNKPIVDLSVGNSNSFIITYEENTELNSNFGSSIIAEKPGLYYFVFNYLGIRWTTCESITFLSHKFTVPETSLVLDKQLLPEYLQWGEVNSGSELTLSSTTSAVDGDILYRKPENGFNMDLLSSGGISCRVADYTDIPSNTKIIVTLKSPRDSRIKVCEGILNEDGTTITITWDAKWDDGTDAMGTTGSVEVATIEETGIYLRDYDQPLGAGFIFITESIQFEGLSFTYTDYKCVKDQQTKFKTMDKKYLPEFKYDLVDEMSIIPLDGTFTVTTNPINGISEVAKMNYPIKFTVMTSMGMTDLVFTFNYRSSDNVYQGVSTIYFEGVIFDVICEILSSETIKIGVLAREVNNG